MESMLHRDAKAAGQGVPLLAAQNSVVSGRRHADEGRDVGTANYKARLNLRDSQPTGAKLDEVNRKGNEAQLLRDRSRRGTLSLRWREERSDIFAQRMNRLGRLLERAQASNSSAIICSARTTACFSTTDRSPSPFGWPGQIRRAAGVIQRSIAADRIFLVEDRPLRVLLGRRFPPVCWRRNLAIEHLCSARLQRPALGCAFCCSMRRAREDRVGGATLMGLLFQSRFSNQRAFGIRRNIRHMSTISYSGRRDFSWYDVGH